MNKTKNDLKKRVYYAEAVYGKEEIDAVADVLLNSSKMLMDHVKVKEFEKKVCEIFGKKYGLMVNSGSSANLLAVSSLKLDKGSEVITPALTFSTTVAPIVQLGLIPAFIDVELASYNIHVDSIEEMIGNNTKALMIPNLLGNIPDWGSIKEIADKYNLIIIEDSADTIGSIYNNGTTGQINDLVTTSFYGSHVMTCGGFGGMVCTNNIEYYEHTKLLQGWGRSSALTQDSNKFDDRFGQSIDNISYDSKFIFNDLGYNFLPSELSAAFGLAQLDRLQSFINRRINNFEYLYRYFSKYKEWFILPEQNPDANTAWLAFPLTVRNEAPFNRNELQIFFESNRIQTRPIFSGNILRQPGFVNIPHKRNSDGYPHADQIMTGGILLGCHQGMNDKQLDYILEVFENYIKKKL